MDGVVAGVEAGGNKSGVPTVNGAVVFDERFSGKPLVYCGTGALMKHQYNGLPTWEKPIDINDRIVMAGGRVGKDGIHGATFSSIEIDEHSPMSAVQIGSPITQKKMYDFLVVACEKGLVKSSTDNGAGGLSSSIGELATISGGAVVYLDKVPLKYSGLRPWEIFVSESQERMSLVIEPQKMEALFTLAAQFEVELTDIGYFTNSGNLHILYNNQTVALLDMHFLHEGVPLKTMLAQYTPPIFDEPNLPKQLDYNQMLLQLLGSFNICSRENIIRQYDHEVKGKTIIKPLMGNKGKAPQDAAVVRMDFDNYEGIAISNGILPRYGDIDAYQMSAGAFDEAVRQIISVGGQLPNINENDGIFWSVNDNFCVPDSDYHPETNPDGKQKLAKLVQMCEALYDMAVAFAIPLTSGKDSMKNDFKADGIKISVPPTILYSMAAKINDVRRTITSEFKAANDLIYQLGETYNELGASEFYHLFNAIGNNVPKVRPQQAKDLYLLVMEANKNGWIQSSHDLSDGGLAVTLAECCFGSNLGANIDVSVLGDMDTSVALFSESHSRFVVTVSPQHQQAFEQLMGNRAFCIGLVTQNPTLSISYQNQQLLHLNNQQMLTAWSNGLEQ
jgi:phosphoribosylformylglycinamidine synthase